MNSLRPSLRGIPNRRLQSTFSNTSHRECKFPSSTIFSTKKDPRAVFTVKNTNCINGNTLLPFKISSLRFMSTKVQAIDLKRGDIICRKEKHFEVTKAVHSAKQQRSGIILLDLVDVVKKTKSNDRLRSNESVEVAEMEYKTFNYKGKSQNGKHIFNNELEDEDSEFDEQFIGINNIPYLQEGLPVTILQLDQKFISIKIPLQVELSVVELEDMGSAGRKAKLSNGMIIRVPTYVIVGDMLIVKTEDGSFVSRADNGDASKRS